MEETRKVQEVNTAFIVNIPKYMAKALGIEKGTDVKMELDMSEKTIKIIKEGKENE